MSVVKDTGHHPRALRFALARPQPRVERLTNQCHDGECRAWFDRVDSPALPVRPLEVVSITAYYRQTEPVSTKVWKICSWKVIPHSGKHHTSRFQNSSQPWFDSL